MSEQIDTFMAITGSDDSKVAEQFLEMAAGELDTAISLFYEHGPSITQQQTISQTGTSPSHNEDDDRQFAERLQNTLHQEEPRVPDQAVHERLVGGDFDDDYHVFPGTFGGGGSFSALLNQGRGINSHSAIFGNGRAGIFNQIDEDFVESDEEDRIAEVDSDGDVIDPNMTATQRRLAKIFRPPWDLIEKLDLPVARRKAREEKKWIMINIQDNAEFQCQVLNRDFWSNKDVKEVVKDNFLFLQYQQDSNNGREYSQFYQFQEYPHIAILDPITGERLKMWNGVPNKSKWIQEVFDFLSQFSLEPGHINPIVSHKKKIDPTTLTEEQQMELAINQSLGNHNTDDEDDVEVLHTGNQNDPIEIDSYSPRESTDEEKFKRIKPLEHPEPENSPTTTRIQIRAGDGSRRVLKFDTRDKVIVIYETVKASFDEVKNGEFFTLTSQRENLISKLDKTIGDAELKNASILLEVAANDE